MFSSDPALAALARKLRKWSNDVEFPRVDFAATPARGENAVERGQAFTAEDNDEAETREAA